MPPSSSLLVLQLIGVIDCEAASQTMINISAESGFVWFEKLVQTAHTRIQYIYTTEPLTDHKSNSLCWLHSQFAIEVRTNCMICNFVSSIVRGCIPRMLTRLARQSTPLPPSFPLQSATVLWQTSRCTCANNSHFCCRLPAVEWERDSLAKIIAWHFYLLFIVAICRPLSCLPALHSLFPFFLFLLLLLCN